MYKIPVISPQHITLPRHFQPNDTRNDGTRVNANANLQMLSRRRVLQVRDGFNHIQSHVAHLFSMILIFFWRPRNDPVKKSLESLFPSSPSFVSLSQISLTNSSHKPNIFSTTKNKLQRKAFVCRDSVFAFVYTRRVKQSNKC